VPCSVAGPRDDVSMAQCVAMADEGDDRSMGATSLEAALEEHACWEAAAAVDAIGSWTDQLDSTVASLGSGGHSHGASDGSASDIGAVAAALSCAR